MPETVNNQRKIKINGKVFREFAENARANISETSGKDFTIAFVSDRKMRKLNEEFRGKSSTTDVLSFPFQNDEFENNEEEPAFSDDYLGDIVISAGQAEKQAAENDLAFEIEIKQLILHGILHLCGYDHETDHGEMNQRELALREILNI